MAAGEVAGFRDAAATSGDNVVNAGGEYGGCEFVMDMGVPGDGELSCGNDKAGNDGICTDVGLGDDRAVGKL